MPPSSKVAAMIVALALAAPIGVAAQEPPRASVLAGVGNAFGWFGGQLEAHLAQGRFSGFAGLGYMPNLLDDEGSGIASAVGIRAFTSGTRHRGFLELSLSALSNNVSSTFVGEVLDKDISYGPGVAVGYQFISDAGFTMVLSGGVGLDEEELAEKIKKISILGIRSKTQVTKKVLDQAERLLGIGAFCIGTNQIDLLECQKKGVAVFNAPYSNTRSVVELAIGEIIFMMRNLIDKTYLMHRERWNKSPKGSYEIRGKKLGIIGYGNIGTQLSVLAESMGMNIYYYDIEEKLALGNATKCDSMDELFLHSDVISLHVDGRTSNKNLIGDEEFKKMKDGVILLNLSRGHVVDIQALKNHLESGKVKGAAIDVFPEEPKNNEDEFESELVGLSNTILTPHIGGSTVEAQMNIADFVPGKIMNYINTGSTSGSVNFPNLTLPTLENAHRLIHIHHNVPGILAHINNVLANHKINIVGQYLKTNETIGYVITDIDKAYDKQVIKDLRSIEHTIRFRILY